MDYNSLSLKMHEENKGKVEVISKVKIKDRDDLSTAYTPELPSLAERSVITRLTYTNIHVKETWWQLYLMVQQFWDLAI